MIHESWKVICDRCGFEYKANELQREWTGLRTCSGCWEERHPQDFIRGVPDRQNVPWSRPEADDSYVSLVVIGGIDSKGNNISGATTASTNAAYIDSTVSNYVYRVINTDGTASNANIAYNKAWG